MNTVSFPWSEAPLAKVFTAVCITIRYTGLFSHFRLLCSLLPAPYSLLPAPYSLQLL
ncbi:MAG: hypothetical protein F6J90_07430 [Moorea sp. SIOASIH]|uniref:hypothetical protein n=1 Tax=Moorena sp. SIOASIH TaxID=2607817 RepID=UPI0013B5ED0C|nr:hypothetical protein [Moorena sp. SIOASIH]NEO36165.1 hypothetical protein [Moorena sp. SIOASIH]